ncbi:MAG: DUF45 domain-containing protein [Acholeplasmatales bacterium]|nr:DUF45 domain-containing protein [Acholeplasmatales bacterium]
MVINVNGFDVNVINIVSKRRSVGLRVINNSIEVYSPYKLKDDDIINMLSRHKRFISRRITGSETSNSIHLLGKEYKLIIISADFNNLIIDDLNNEIRVYSKKLDEYYVRAIIDNYYNSVLDKIVRENIDEIKKCMNINYDIEFQYKRVNTYFGECFSKRRKVILNTKMAKYEKIYIISVICHELAHFYYQNHQDGFYNLLEKVFPNYRKVQSNLRKIKYNEKY